MSDAQLYARPRIASSQRRSLSIFDRSTFSRQTVPGGPDPGVQLMGADGMISFSWVHTTIPCSLCGFRPSENVWATMLFT